MGHAQSRSGNPPQDEQRQPGSPDPTNDSSAPSSSHDSAMVEPGVISPTHHSHLTAPASATSATLGRKRQRSVEDVASASSLRREDTSNDTSALSPQDATWSRRRRTGRHSSLGIENHRTNDPLAAPVAQTPSTSTSEVPPADPRGHDCMLVDDEQRPDTLAPSIPITSQSDPTVVATGAAGESATATSRNEASPSTNAAPSILIVPDAVSADEETQQPTPSPSPTPAEYGEGTPPPHLDALHEERERARRQILEALSSGSASVDNTATPLQPQVSPMATSSSLPTGPTTASMDAAPSAPAPAPASSSSHSPSSATHPITSATLAALLGTAAEARRSIPLPHHSAESNATEASIPFPTSAAASDLNTATAGSNAPAQSPGAGPREAGQLPHNPNTRPARSAAAGDGRTMLHPATISGTSMIVQGALVARTLPSRRSATSASASDAAGEARPDAASTSNRSSSSATNSAGADASSGDAGMMPNSDDPRPVTLEEQAVMLSRILGIAAAVTAASLVNTSSTQQVDRTLLQSSLQPSLAAMNQTNASQGGGPALGSWRHAPTSRTTRMTPSTNRPSPSTAAASSLLGTGLRQRLASLSQRVRSASQNLGLAASSSSSSSPPSSSTPSGHDSTTRSASSTFPSRAAGPDTGSATESGEDAEESAHRQEVIAQLLEAADREAEAARRRMQAFGASPPPQSATGRARATSLNIGSDRVRPRAGHGPVQSSTQSSASLDTAATADIRTGASEAAAVGNDEHASRMSVARFVRETLGQLIAPGRHSRAETQRRVQGFSPAATSASASNSSRGSSTQAGGNQNDSPYLPTPEGFSLGPNDVSGTLQQVRTGVMPDGVPGSFGNFLHHLLRDLMAAVQSMHPEPAAEPSEQAEASTTDYFERAHEHETTNGAEVLDGEDGAAAADSASRPSASEAPTAAQDTTASANTTSFQAQAARMRAEAQSSASPDSADAATQTRRERDIQNGNLSFFRIFRFDPVAPSPLVPCIVVGVRSLDVTERLGEDMRAAETAARGGAAGGGPFGGAGQQTSRPTTLGTDPETATAQAAQAQQRGSEPAREGEAEERGAETREDELPASRFLLFVSGGRYPANHPLLTSNPSAAGRDLMVLMDLLGAMQASQNKPSTVTQQEIDGSELAKIRGDRVAGLVAEGKITENMAERCLVCLEDWKRDDECRLMACRHVFHTSCVDRWMTNSSNTCPMCRRQGVSKDGRRAGEETADSRNAPQI